MSEPGAPTPSAKKVLDVAVRPQDVSMLLGAKEWEILCLRRENAVLAARVDELEAGLPGP